MKKLSLMIAAVAICVVSVAGCGGSDNSTSKPDVNLGEAKEVNKKEIEDVKKNMKGKKFETSDGEMGGATTRDMSKQ